MPKVAGDFGQLTQYGFTWGPAEVQRATFDERYRTLLIRTDYQEVQIHISPSGRSIRVYQHKRAGLGKNDASSTDK